jgi:hypothetical protein
LPGSVGTAVKGTDELRLWNRSKQTSAPSHSVYASLRHPGNR